MGVVRTPVRIPKGRPLLPIEAKTVEHGTPPEIYIPLYQEFKFTLDAAASAENTKCRSYYSKEKSGLTHSWAGHDAVWINPPYTAKMLKAFMGKVLNEVLSHDLIVVMLMPVKTDQSWWHELWAEYSSPYSLYRIEYRWIKGRIRFLGNKDRAGFPNVVIVISPAVWE